MKAIILVTLCLGVLLSTPAEALNVPEAVLCLECRDPQSHPEDWRNYAFNLAREGDMSYAELDPLQNAKPTRRLGIHRHEYQLYRP